MRYVRNGDVLVQQWKDRCTVSMLSTIHKGHSHVMVTRHAKVQGQHVELNIWQPVAVNDYNTHMGGVDTFEQWAAAYRVLRRTRIYWKSIFLDMMDVAAMNAFLMFTIYLLLHPDTFYIIYCLLHPIVKD